MNKDSYDSESCTCRRITEIIIWCDIFVERQCLASGAERSHQKTSRGDQSGQTDQRGNVTAKGNRAPTVGRYNLSH